VSSTIATVAVLPVVFLLVFYFSERSLHRWVGGRLDQDIDMPTMIARGEFKKTPQGAYLISLNDAFPPGGAGRHADAAAPDDGESARASKATS
jgi:hypothetical protein